MSTVGDVLDPKPRRTTPASAPAAAPARTRGPSTGAASATAPATATAVGRAPTRSLFLRAALAALIAASVVLPTGTVFGLPVKHAAYAATLLALLTAWLSGRIRVSTRWLLGFVLLLAYVLIFAMLGFSDTGTTPGLVLQEAIGVFSAISIVLLIHLAVASGQVERQEVVAAVMIGALLFATWKVAVVLGLVTGVLDFGRVYFFFLEKTGYRLVSSGIFGGLVRINLIIYDFLVAAMLVIMVVVPQAVAGVPRVLRWLFAVIGSMCLLFAFSRLLFGIVAVGLAVGFMFRLSWSGKVIVALVIGLAITASLPWLQGAIEQRFSSVQAVASDDLRGAQIVALVEEWSRSPLIGNGFGTYAHSLVRDTVALYSYEVQWVGFLAKLGLLGIGVLAALVLMLFRAVMAGGLSIERCMLGMILSAFVLGGFTNQYLVSSASGIVYGLILVVAGMLPRRRPFEQKAHAWSARHAHP